MPIKDPKRRKEVNKAWRERSHTKAYMKFLYDRRAHRFWKAEQFERVLQMISDGNHVGTAQEVAAMWLYEAKQRELKVGLFFDHELDKPSNEPSRKGGVRRELADEETEEIDAAGKAS